MKIVTIICNIALFLFTCLVLVTDGIPREASYIVFTLWTLLTLILNSVVISHSGMREQKMENQSSMSTIMRVVAIICNIVLLGFFCWALVDQFPHPEEDGVVAFTVLMGLTPILSLLVLFSGGSSNGWPGFQMKAKTVVPDKLNSCTMGKDLLTVRLLAGGTCCRSPL